MSIKEFATIKKLNEIHNQLKNKFKDSAKDIKDAQQLEDFFNYLVYDKNVNIDNNPFLKNMSNETKKLIQNSSYIKELNILRTVGGQQQLSGQAGEEALSYLILQAIAQLDKTIKEQLEANAEELVEKIIMGNVQATTLSKEVAEQIVSRAAKNGEKAMKNTKQQYGVYAFRQGKIDINTNLLGITITTSPEVERLLHLSASVKNYQRYVIHLETVNRKKAYQGIMANLYPSMSGHQTSAIFDYYYSRKAVRTSEVAAKHFLHITNLYALSGLGQIYIDRTNNTVIEENLGARFLIANIANKEIIVIPVSQIASSLHDKKYGDLFSYENKEKDTWEQRKAISVYLHLNKYKKLRS